MQVYRQDMFTIKCDTLFLVQLDPDFMFFLNTDNIGIKVPKCEIFHCSEFHYFYTTLWNEHKNSLTRRQYLWDTKCGPL